MNNGRCGQAWLHTVVAVAVVQVVLLWPSGVSAQTKSLLDQGVGAAQFSRCQVDVVTGDTRRATVMLAAFAPDAATRLVTDENAEIPKMCAHQIHQQRCTKDIVALVGDLLTEGRPGSKLFLPSANPYSAVLGTGGALIGLAFGERPLLSGALLGYGGAVAGNYMWEGQHATGCIERQRALDNVSLKLQGSVRVLSASALTDLIESNVGSTISRGDADVLKAETEKLSVRYIEVMNSLR
jgi:hypothetical protein